MARTGHRWASLRAQRPGGGGTRTLRPAPARPLAATRPRLPRVGSSPGVGSPARRRAFEPACPAGRAVRTGRYPSPRHLQGREGPGRPSDRHLGMGWKRLSRGWGAVSRVCRCCSYYQRPGPTLAQAGLELAAILLPRPPECRDGRRAPPAQLPAPFQTLPAFTAAGDLGAHGSCPAPSFRGVRGPVLQLCADAAPFCAFRALGAVTGLPAGIGCGTGTAGSVRWAPRSRGGSQAGRGQRRHRGAAAQTRAPEDPAGRRAAELRLREARPGPPAWAGASGPGERAKETGAQGWTCPPSAAPRTSFLLGVLLFTF